MKNNKFLIIKDKILFKASRKEMKEFQLMDYYNNYYVKNENNKEEEIIKNNKGYNFIATLKNNIILTKTIKRIK